MIDLEINIHELQRLAQLMGGRLQLGALVDGSLSGSHQSPRMGSSLDFAHHRDYLPGDDLRHLDWRAYAKNDRYVVKQYQEETNLRAHMVVDRSNSMNYQGGGLSKKGVYASQLALVLSWMFFLQDESVGVLTFGSEIQTYLPARSRRDHFWRILDVLKSDPWLEETHASKVIRQLGERLPPKGVVFLITDGFDFRVSANEANDHQEAPNQAVDQTENALEILTATARRLRKQGQHLIVIHILDPYELTFPFDELSLFEGLEGEEALKLDPEGIRKAYLKEIHDFCDAFRHQCLSGGISYCRCSTDQSLETSLLSLLEEVNR